MQKKLLAVAVLSAFSGLASAQSANVTLFGNLVSNWELNNSQNSDGTTFGSAGANSSFRGNLSGTSAGFTSLAGAYAIGSAGLAAGAINAAAASGNAGTVFAASTIVNTTTGVGPGILNTTARLNTAGSEFGVRGTEDLGNGLSAWFTLTLSPGGLGATSPMNGTNGGTAITMRNSGFGLRSNTWGTTMLGIWDTPFTQAYNFMSVNGRTGTPSTSTQANIMGGNAIANGAWSGWREDDACNLTGGAANSTYTSVGACFGAGTQFDRRQRNIAQWWSNNWNGFEAKLAYASINNGGGAMNPNRVVTTVSGAAATVQTVSAAVYKPQIWDMSVQYTNGALGVIYAYERQSDLLAYTMGTVGGDVFVGGQVANTNMVGINTRAITGSRNTGHRLGAKYTWSLSGGNKIGMSAVWERLDYRIDYTGTNVVGVAGVNGINAVPVAYANLTGLKKTAWRLQGNWETGSHFFSAEYARAASMVGSTDGSLGQVGNFGSSGAREWILGYNYLLSKRTSVGAYYTGINNDVNARYTGLVFGGVTTAAGAQNKYYGVTIKHSF